MTQRPFTLSRRVLLAVVALLAVPSLTWSQVAGSEGIKQGEKFAKAGKKMLDAIGDARSDVSATLTAYNDLVNTPSGDVKGDYRKLQKALEKAKKSTAKVKPLMEAMTAESEAYYRIWAGQVSNIADADLRSLGEERITSSRGEYERILADLRTTGAALAPFVKDLNDQINFLGSDLRPDAIASLKDNATKLNARGTELFSRTDTAVNAADTYFAPLRAK